MKRAVLPLAMLIIGLIIGYYIHYYVLIKKLENFDKSALLENNSDEVKEIVNMVTDTYDKQAFQFVEGSHRIEPTLADTLISQYKKQNDNGLFPLKCRNSKGERVNLEGFFIDRGPLDTILQDTRNVGVSVYFAKQRDAYRTGLTSRFYTFIYMGAKKKNTTLQQQSNESIKYSNSNNDGKIYDFIDPCPDACGDFTQQMQLQRRSRKPQQQ